MAEHRHAWIPDQMQVGLSCPDCGLVYSDWAQDEIKRLQVREIRLCSELARLALDYVATQDEAHADLDEQQLAAEMLVFVDTWQT